MDRNSAPRTLGALAVATPFRSSRETRVRPARRIDLLVHFAGAFDLVEEQSVGHAARIAYLAHCVAENLRLSAEERARVLHVGLLHEAGAALPHEAAPEASAWVAERFGLDAQVVEAVRAARERWDGSGGPLGLAGTAIPVEALCVRAAHWAAEYTDHVDHPLRARASLQRADEAELIPLVGADVADALRDVLRDDQTWLAVYGEDLPGHVARLGVSEGKPSRRRVEEAVAAMGAVVDAALREPERGAHVSALARALAARLGLSDGTCETVALAGYLLDIGQMAVPPEILDKPSILTVEEMELMRRHPGIGARLLEAIPGFDEVAAWVEEHHERPDGRGYPEMLDDDDLGLAPRILAVADAYWALRAHRPYRPAHGPEEALDILLAGAGRQFDADVVEALPAALETVEQVLSAV